MSTQNQNKGRKSSKRSNNENHNRGFRTEQPKEEQRPKEEPKEVKEPRKSVIHIELTENGLEPKLKVKTDIISEFDAMILIAELETLKASLIQKRLNRRELSQNPFSRLLDMLD